MSLNVPTTDRYLHQLNPVARVDLVAASNRPITLHVKKLRR
jgi:hypothetical protein